MRRLLVRWILGLLLPCQPTTWAAPAPVEAFFRPPTLTTPTISPDGRYLAWVHSEKWAGSLALFDIESRKMTLVDPVQDEGIAWVFWANDRRLLFGAKDSDGALGGIYAVDADGSHFKQLVPSVLRQAVKVAYGARAARPISRIAGDPDHVLVEFRRIFEVKSKPGLYRLHVRSGARTLVEEADERITGWLTDGTGTIRGFVREAEDGWDFFHREAPGQSWKRFLTTKAWQNTGGLNLELGCNGELYLGAEDGRGNGVLVRHQPKANSNPEPLLRLEGFDFGESRLLFSADRCQLLGAYVEADRPRFLPASPEAARMHARIDSALPGRVAIIAGRSESGHRQVIAAFSDRHPTEYFLYEPAAGKLAPIQGARPWLAPDRLSPMEPFEFTSRDGLKIHGYLTPPAPGTQSDSKPPMVVLPHGGPWVRDTWGFNGEVQFLASRGYAVLQVNFRGSTGYGQEFAAAGSKEWGAAMQDDITDAVRWAIAQGHADPDRIGILGASYGGYAAMAGLCFTPELYRCGVNLYGVTDIRDFLKELPRERELLRRNMQSLVGDMKGDKSLLDSRSPSHNAEKIRVPVLMAYGRRDTVVDIEQGEELHKQLRRNGKEVRYLVKPDEGHGYRKRENVLELYGEIERFLDRHLRNAPPRP